MYEFNLLLNNSNAEIGNIISIVFDPTYQGKSVFIIPVNGRLYTEQGEEYAENIGSSLDNNYHITNYTETRIIYLGS
jgi:hypothetical protein